MSMPRAVVKAVSAKRQRRAVGRGRWLTGAIVVMTLTASGMWPLGAQQDVRPTFRIGTTTVSVDVVVRDESGAIVRGLTEADFTILEDGRAQKIDTFTFQEITDRPRPPLETSVLAGVEERLREEVQRVAGAATTTATANAEPLAPELSGRRLVVLLFDRGISGKIAGQEIRSLRQALPADTPLIVSGRAVNLLAKPIENAQVAADFNSVMARMRAQG